MISRAILYITTLILMIAVGWMGLGSIVIASTTISKDRTLIASLMTTTMMLLLELVC